MNTVIICFHCNTSAKLTTVTCQCYSIIVRTVAMLFTASAINPAVRVMSHVTVMYNRHEFNSHDCNCSMLIYHMLMARKAPEEDQKSAQKED